MTLIRPYVHLAPKVNSPWTVPALCKAYDWPAGLAGGGIIAIVELGGGWNKTDMEAYFASIHQPMPSITDVSVDGTTNTPGSDADYEVALDIQVSAAAYYVAAGVPATIRVYWASDIAPAIQAAVKDGCDVFSCSWGADEASWGPVAASALEQAAIDAGTAGMAIFAASGDSGSSDGGPGLNVDLPAGCPHIVGCGGTTKTAAKETAWSMGGGGYSSLFPAQSWQIGVTNAPGRMVPDVSADADPNTGLAIVVNGTSVVVGGTSAVAPLYAGLFAALGRKLGWVTPNLFANADDFSDITVGSNGAYKAGPGPDPCTGIGAPDGSKIATLYAASGQPAPQPQPIPQPPSPAPTPTPPPVPSPTPAPPIPPQPTPIPTPPAPSPQPPSGTPITGAMLKAAIATLPD